MPKVSIGLPVFNGEAYVAGQIESLLAQTFTDFELAIVDNASTDRTSEICRSFADRDKRVKYHRNDRNIGGGPNTNRAFDLATPALYFKWAAHDDIHGPTFIQKCVEALDRDPGAVLAFTKAEFIDPDGKTIRPRVLELPLSSPDARVRFEALLPSYDCLEIFGVIRRSALPEKPVIGLYKDADGVLLTRLALTGPILEVPEVAFFNRRHATQAGTQYEHDYHKWAVWWDPRNVNRRVFPNWRRNLELWKAVFAASMSANDRMRCAVSMARWTWWRRHRLYEDISYHMRDLVGSARRSKSTPQNPIAPP